MLQLNPTINKNSDYIEIIGHYDDKVLCAKMTLLAELYAVEYRNGYAKFRIEDEDKIETVSSNLLFPPAAYITVYIRDKQDNLIYSFAEMERDLFTLSIASDGKIYVDGSMVSTYHTDDDILGFSRDKEATEAEFSEFYDHADVVDMVFYVITATPSIVDISYKNASIANLTENRKSVTLNCKDKLMEDNVRIVLNGGGKGGNYNIVQTNDGDNCSLAITDANTFVLTTKTITANGTYAAAADNADGYSQVTVALPVYDGSVV